MKQNPSPAFQFYPRDWLSSEGVRVMSPSARGIYITLLCVCWLEGSLPSNDEQLARLADASIDEWTQASNVVKSRFFEREGRLYHQRLNNERAKQRKYKQLQSDKGRKSVEARLNRGSIPVEPKVNSSSSSSSSVPLATLAVDTAPTRTNPLAHKPRVNVAWAGRPPVPGSLHAEFIEKLGGDRNAASDRLRAWYPTAAEVYADQEIGDDDFRFWRARFREWIGTTVGRGERRAAAQPTYPEAWCDHDPRCASPETHALLLLRNAEQEG